MRLSEAAGVEDVADVAGLDIHGQPQRDRRDGLNSASSRPKSNRRLRNSLDDMADDALALYEPPPSDPDGKVKLASGRDALPNTKPPCWRRRRQRACRSGTGAGAPTGVAAARAELARTRRRPAGAALASARPQSANARLTQKAEKALG